jgi:hypothetical protein
MERAAPAQVSAKKLPPGSAHKASLERTARTIEKYQGKRALMETWKTLDPEYYRQLKRQASGLRHTLVTKGVL